MARTKATHKLSNVKLTEVSLVGKGDNPSAHVLLLKTKPDTISDFEKGYGGENKNALLKTWFNDNVSTILKDSDCTAETFDEILQNKDLRDKIWDMIWTLQDSISSIINDDTVTDKAILTEQSVAQFQQAVSALIKKGGSTMTPEEIVALKKAKEEAEAKVADLQKQLDEAKALAVEKGKAPAAGEKCSTCGTVAKEAEGIDKSALPESVQKYMEEQEVINKANAEEITKLKEENLTKECVEKAAAVPAVGESAAISGLLKEITKVAPALADKVFAVFKTASTRIIEGGLFKENGKQGEGEGMSAVDKINKLAADLVAADTTGKLTKEQAFDKVYSSNHELRKAYHAEKP